MNRAFMEEVIAQPPFVHEGGTTCWKISPGTARFLLDTLQAGWRTLETGCGLSTLLFASRVQEHWCVVPNGDEVERLCAFAKEHKLPLANVHFVVEKSQRAFCSNQLDGLEEALDFALIDGCHAFPTPFMDWYFIEPLLRRGAYLMIDDIDIWTGRTLRDFLRSDQAWRFSKAIENRSCVFEKLEHGSNDRGWNEQHYVYARSWKPRVINAVQSLKRLFVQR